MTAQITALPTPPSTNDPANFNTRADAFLGQMPTFVTEANALAGEVNANTQAAAASATAAANKVVEATGKAAEAAASAASALNAPGTNGTSATSLTIGIGTKTFTTQTGKAWAVGQGFFVASTASPLNQMSGILTAYNSGNGAATVEVTAVAGSGAFGAWTVGMAAGAPMPVASQAEAEAGTDSAKVMTALRTSQAITALSALSATSTVTGDITLSSFGQLVPVQMATFGKSVTLPDATTRAKTGGPLLLIDNTQGAYAVGIRDNTGRLLTAVAPGGSASAFLKSNATAAGIWTITGSDLEPGLITAESLLNNWIATHGAYVALNSSVTVHFVSTPSGFAAFVVDAAGRAISTPVTVSSTAGDTPKAAFKISPTSLIVFFGADSFTTTHRAVVLTLTGTSPSLGLSVGSAVTFTTPNSMFGGSAWGAEDGVGAPRIVQLTSTLYLAAFATNPTPPQTSAVAISVSGSTITIGAPVSAGTSFQPGNSGPIIQPVTASSALVFFTGGASPQTVYAAIVSVSGTTVTWGTVTNTGMDFGVDAIPNVAVLSATKAMVVVHDTANATVRGAILTVSGSALSVGTVSSLFSLSSGTLQYASDGANRFRPHLLVNSANSAVLWWMNGSSSGSVVLTEVSGQITQGGVFTGLFSNGTGSGGYQGLPLLLNSTDIVYGASVGSSTNTALSTIGNVAISGLNLFPERVVELPGVSPLGSTCAGKLANGDIVASSSANNNTALNILRGVGSSLRSRGTVTRLPAGQLQTQGGPIQVNDTGAILLLRSGSIRVVSVEFAA